MKALLIILVLSLTYSLSIAQEVEMVIDLNDGGQSRFNVDSVVKMSATGVPEPWSRVVTYHDYLGYTSFSGNFATAEMRFIRESSGLYLYGPGGTTKIAGDRPTPPWPYTDYLTFGLHSEGGNIIRLPESVTFDPTHVATAWHDTIIYAAGDYDPWRYDMDPANNVISEMSLGLDNAYFNIETSPDGRKLAYSLLGRKGLLGRLCEIDLETRKVDTLTVDSMVSTVRYIGTTNEMIYYSFGSYDYADNPKPADAGYYRLDRATGQSTFLLHHPPMDSPEGELLNGFDVSSDGKKLLVPTASSDRQVLTLAEFDIESGRLDTLKVELYPKKWYNTLWTQYSNDDSRILYSLTWMGRVPSFLGSESSVGVIDRNSLTTEQVFVSPTNARPFSAPYPRWSPDEDYICYGGCVIPEYVLDSIGPWYVYVKKL